VSNASEGRARSVAWQFEQIRVGLQQEGRLQLSELITLDAQSPYYTNSGTRGLFDAQSWGVIHYLLFGRPDDRGDRVNQLAKLLLGGRSSAEAIQEVYSSVEALESAYLQYQRKPITQYARFESREQRGRERLPGPHAPGPRESDGSGGAACRGGPARRRAIAHRRGARQVSR
jgi:hypothetical protein